MKKFVYIGDFLIDPEYFYVFYIEHIPSGQFVLFGESIKSDTCWHLAVFNTKEEAEKVLERLWEQISKFY